MSDAPFFASSNWSRRSLRMLARLYEDLVAQFDLGSN
jgi:hypothetical protein